MTSPGSHEFTVRDSQTVFTGAILALRTDEVTMPGGTTAQREVVEKHGAVAVLARDDDGAIALVNQYRHPVGRRLLELPAGLLDGGPAESPLQAAQRELAEEAGLAAGSWRTLVDLDSSPGFTDESIRVFLAEDLRTVDGGERRHEEADLVVSWLRIGEAVDAALSGEIVNAIAVAGILAAAAADARDTALRAPDAHWADRPHRFDSRR